MSHLSFQFGRRKTEDGYTAELLLPWSNLNVTPKPGLETALQIYVMESDDGEKSKTAMWHPAGEGLCQFGCIELIFRDAFADP